MSELDVWLQNNHQLSRIDVRLNIEKIAANASRYSKEHTLPPRDVSVDLSDDASIATEIEDWVSEVERSAEEDEQGVYREGEDMQVANAIATSRAALRKIGSEASLAKFPFHQIPTEAHQFFCRALQKELGSSLKKMGKVDRVGSALVYADKNLRRILEMEF